MSSFQIHTIKSFTKNLAQGNPAGVVFPADFLSELEMIQIAKTLGFSESAFLQKSQRADVKVVFASPSQIVNLCGHGTVAAFHVWLSLQEDKFAKQSVISQTMETVQGDLLTIICHQDGLIEMVQKPSVFDPHIFSPVEIAPLLGIKPESFRKDMPIQIVSVGTPKLLVPLHSFDALIALQPDFKRIKQFGQEHSCFGIYPFYQHLGSDFDFEARQFNPLMGINEDPITGIAAGALGAYNQKYGLIKKERFVVRQGYLMNQGGEISVQTEEEIKIGGYAVKFISDGL